MLPLSLEQLTASRSTLGDAERLLLALAQTAAVAAGCAGWREWLDQVAGDLAAPAGADRLYLYRRSLDCQPPLLQLEFDWHRPQWPDLRSVPGANPLRLMEMGALGARLIAAHRDGRPLAWVESRLSAADRRAFAGFTARAVLTVPVMIADEWWGCLGFVAHREERQWRDTETAVLSAFAELLAVVVTRAGAVGG